MKFQIKNEKPTFGIQYFKDILEREEILKPNVEFLETYFSRALFGCCECWSQQDGDSYKIVRNQLQEAIESPSLAYCQEFSKKAKEICESCKGITPRVYNLIAAVVSNKVF